MTRLLWLCTLALGLRMYWEMTDYLRPWTARRVRRWLVWASYGWLAYLVWTAVWFWRQP